MAADDFAPHIEVPARAFIVQPSGRIVVGGDLRTIAGLYSLCSAVLLNDNGTLAGPPPHPYFSGTVQAMVLQLDGKILVGGSLQVKGGRAQTNLVRLNADWTFDDTFNLSTDGEIRCMALQPDGRILLGGTMTNVGGMLRRWLVRLHADGTVDTTFQPSLDNAVNALAVQPDGKIVLAGNFTTVAGQPRTGLARLEANGALDASFTPDDCGGIRAILVQPDGRLVVGGSFTYLGGESRNRLARLHPDGSLDLAFNPNANNTIYSLALQADGKLMVCGNITRVDNQSRNLIARLLSSGALDESFLVAASHSDSALSGALALQKDGKILVSSIYGQLGGQIRTNLGRLHNTELATESLEFDTHSIRWRRGGTSPEVWHTQFAMTTNGVDWVDLGAGVRTAEGWQLDGLDLPAKVTIRARGFVTGGMANGSAWYVETEAGCPRLAGQPQELWVAEGGEARFEVRVTGSLPLGLQWYSTEGAIPDATNTVFTVTKVTRQMAGLAYWMTASNSWGTVTSAPVVLKVQAIDAIHPGVNVIVRAFAVQPDGKVLIGGNFTSVAGQPRFRVARLNPDATLDVGFAPQVNNRVNCIALQEDGRILIGGEFTVISGQTRHRIARLLPDGSLDASFDANISGQVNGLIVQPDGKILAAGFFNTVNGQSRQNLARLYPNGTLDLSFNPSISVFNGFTGMALQNDGKLLIAGDSFTIEGQTRHLVARLTENGDLDPSFNLQAVVMPGINRAVEAISLQADGRMILGGTFALMRTLYDAELINLGRLLPDGTLDSDYCPRLIGGTVRTLALQTDQNCFVGGGFTNANMLARQCLALIRSNGTTDTAFDVPAGWSVHGLGLDQEGKLWVGGDFTRLGGVISTNLGRIHPTLPAMESFQLAGNHVIWRRGGSAPEVYRTSFACTTNGVDWQTLGEGVRIPGGWQVAAGNLPSNVTVRARGFLTGGHRNGSHWHVESGLGPPVLINAPTDKIVPLGGATQLDAYALGSKPLAYQWFSTAGPLSGATNAFLRLSGLQVEDSGTGYWVVASNALGSVTSAVATITVPLDYDADGMPDGWEQEHGLTVGMQDQDADPDGDGMSNWREYVAGTHPLQADSVFRLAVTAVGGGLTLRFEAKANRGYTIEYQTELGGTNWLRLDTVPAAPSNRWVELLQPLDSPQRFYRIGIPVPQ